jgi:hypothetical protein
MKYCGNQIRHYFFRKNIPRISCTKVVVGQNHAKKRGRGLSLPLPDKKIGRATFQSLLQKNTIYTYT